MLLYLDSVTLNTRSLTRWVEIVISSFFNSEEQRLLNMERAIMNMELPTFKQSILILGKRIFGKSFSNDIEKKMNRSNLELEIRKRLR